MIVFEHSMRSVMIWIGVIAAVTAAAYSYWCFVRKDFPTAAMAVVRLLFFLLLAWCLFMPGLKRVLTQMLKPRFIVAIDTSNSMLLRPSEDVSNRWFEAMQALDQPWTKIVAAECEVDTYAFATDVGPRLSPGAARALAPQGASTLLRDALERITGRYAGLDVTGCLLLTDGIDTREAVDDWASEARPFPIHTVLLEPQTAWAVEPDVRIDTVNTPRRVTVGWKTELKAVVSGQGMQGRPITVQLFKDNALQQEQPTLIPIGGGAREVLFELHNPEIGVFTYRILVPPLAGESHTNDNEYALSVQVITARNHLLYVEGAPRWESKYLTRALRANQQMTPLIFLRGPDGRFMTFGQRDGMTAEMRESQLASFKIVILGNLNAEELGELRAKNLVRFVETGGSLVLLGGSEAWGENGFARTSLRKLLPGRLSGSASLEGEFPVSLTDAGRTHPAFAGDPNLWIIIPPVLSVFPGVDLSPGARALVAAQTPDGPQPIIVSHRYGQGKVAAVFTDSIWKWQLSPHAIENKPYRRFWNQLIAWLAPEEKEIEDRELELFADREQMFLGEEIEISARPNAEEAGAADIAIRCNITGPDKRTIPFSMSKHDVTAPSGRSFPGYAFRFKAEQPGLHTAVAFAEIEAQTVESDPVSFFVKPFTPESVPRPANVDVLKAIAANSGARYSSNLQELDDVLSSLSFAGIEEEIAEYKSLWQHWLIIGGLITFLLIGWAIRKSLNMP